MTTDRQTSRIDSRHRRLLLGDWLAALAVRVREVVGALAVSVLTVGAWSAVLQAQSGGVVAGTVIDARTLRGVAGAQVAVEGTALGALSDGSGGFRIANVQGTQVTLQVRRIGYKPGGERSEERRVGKECCR